MLRHLTISIVAFILASANAANTRAADDHAEPAQPESPSAKAAIDKANRAVGEAERAYRHALTTAKKQLIQDLKASQSTAMKATNLTEANAIAATIKKTEADLTAIEGEKFTIKATEEWQQTIAVKRGQSVYVIARGKWSYNRYKNLTAGPDGVPKDDGTKETWGHLEGRIGNGPAFKIGTSVNFVADADGILEMEMHDPFHNDNEGSIDVVIAHW